MKLREENRMTVRGIGKVTHFPFFFLIEKPPFHPGSFSPVSWWWSRYGLSCQRGVNFIWENELGAVLAAQLCEFRIWKCQRGQNFCLRDKLHLYAAYYKWATTKSKSQRWNVIKIGSRFEAGWYGLLGVKKWLTARVFKAFWATIHFGTIFLEHNLLHLMHGFKHFI